MNEKQERTLVTGGAVIRDGAGCLLLQQRSDYGAWGLPGGGMEPGETIEQTMRREVLEETGLEVTDCSLLGIYTGPRMRYEYPDGGRVVFVMFIFEAKVDLDGKLEEDGRTLRFRDTENESLRLEFRAPADITLEEISSVQRPVFEDLRSGRSDVLRT
ncbi:NUDIX domain-containing protein [Saccharibacillus sp. CPCC 101409]|uniref:NUDIX domain-containing protein n=1 Tax=Saccharibacillus sp. CPCC 101409 TaxID=3058041 RepID=UPI002673B7AB|nr:NUDIX domain-containing protein [Saccharibacillus sp. CPCC 101409]MDO3411244.1 NUDIX domain-containing protein [Saccharibacillus sp. CPCC 101409]